MRSIAVVVSSPRFDLFLSIVEARKPVLVQALVPELSIETLDKRVLYGLSQPDERKLHFAFVRPPIKRRSRELGTIVSDDRL